MLSLSAAGAAANAAGGVTSIQFRPSVMSALGVTVEGAGTAAPQLPGQLGFAADDPSTLRFAAPGGDFEGFAGGELQHRGELRLRMGARVLELSDFVLRVAADPLDLDLYDRAGRRRLRLEAAQPHVRDRELHLQNIDVTVAAELAEELGHPELAGMYLGHAHLRVPLPVDPSGAVRPAGSGQCDDVFTADRDVTLEQLGIVSQLQRESGGRVSLTLPAVLRNVGTSAIVWKEAIEPDGAADNVGEHPYLALHLYRLSDGRLKQIGRADVKHAFYTINTDCPCSGGHVIYPGCVDVYGANTNANRIHLAPREEVDATSGGWTRTGSHFDALPVDDFRDHYGESDHDGFEHLLTVQEADLQEPGEFFVEGWYMVRDDVDLLNSMGNYRVEPTLGMVWTFGTDSVVTLGSILDRLVAAKAPGAIAKAGLLDTGEGRLQLAVLSTDLGAGRYHHEYALMNFDFDRRIGAVEIALAPGVDVSDAEFVDVDRDAGNDWPATVADDKLTWTAPAGNTQDWGTLFSFAFDADAAAPELSVTAFAAEAGVPASYTLATAEVVDLPPIVPDPGADEDDSASGTLALGPLLAVLLALVALAFPRRCRR